MRIIRIFADRTDLTGAEYVLRIRGLSRDSDFTEKEVVSFEKNIKIIKTLSGFLKLGYDSVQTTEPFSIFCFYRFQISDQVLLVGADKLNEENVLVLRRLDGSCTGEGFLFFYRYRFHSKVHFEFYQQYI